MFVDEPCQIEEGLFLGSASTAAGKESLKALNVTHVLTIARTLEPAHPGDFEYKKIDAVDFPTENLRKHFNECFDFIDRARQGGGGVLVHCFAGISRSATVVIAYLMKQHGIGRLQATALVRSKRPQVAPNFGFVRQLDEFENSILGPVELDGEPPVGIVEGWSVSPRLDFKELMHRLSGFKITLFRFFLRH